MTTPTGQITVTDIDSEANRKPYPSAYATPNPDPTFPLTVKWPVAVFGNDPNGAQWANVLERNSAYETSFNALRGKQNAFTLYNSTQFFYVGGCGEGEKDTITPGLKLDYFYPYLTDDMWFSIDVASPSTTGSRAMPGGGTLSWDVCSAGNYNGAYEVWRHFFRVKPIQTTRTYTDLGYARMQDVGAGSEQMAAFNNYNVTKDSRGNIVTYYYNIRYGFGRDSGNIYGNRTFIYYRPTDKVVYAAGQYDGFKNNSPIYKSHIYLMRVMFWPPETITIGNLTGGAKEYGATTPNATNNEHTQYINGMNAYLGQFPPITPTIPIDGGKVTVPPTPPNIATDGNPNRTTPGGGGCKIICTKLYELGLMSEDVFKADQEFGEKLRETNPDIYNGYLSWAQMVVDWMEGNGPGHCFLFWIRDKEKKKEFVKKVAVDWAYKIATPWAEWMAGKKNNTGYALWAIGAPISKVVGIWNKWLGKKEETNCKTCNTISYNLKGLALYLILAGLRVVAMFDGKKK